MVVLELYVTKLSPYQNKRDRLQSTAGYFEESSGLRTVHWLPCGTLPIAMGPFLRSAPLHKLGHKTCLIKGVRLVEIFPNQLLCTCTQKSSILYLYVCPLKVFIASLWLKAEKLTEFCWNQNVKKPCYSNNLFYFALFINVARQKS